jgi:hypothetical protein
MHRPFVVIALAVAVISAVPLRGGAADLVVIDSSIASLPIGSMTPAEAPVNIPAGQSVTLIASDGSTLVIAGPYAGPIGAGAQDAPGALERLSKSRGESGHVVGAIRAPSWDK